MKKSNICKYLILVFVLFISHYNSAQLNGIKTIGGTSPDFTSIKQAIHMVDSLGVNGPLIFNIRNGVYSENIVLNQISGASLVNTITFQSESTNPVSVTIEGDSLNVFENKSTNIRFKNLTFSVVISAVSTEKILFFNEISDCSVENCKFIQQNSSATGIFAINNNVIANNIIIANSDFNCDNGIWFEGNIISHISLIGNSFNSLIFANYIKAVESVQSVLIDNSTIVKSENGIYIEGMNIMIVDLTISNSVIHSNSSCVKITSNQIIKDIQLLKNTLTGTMDINSNPNEGISIISTNVLLQNIEVNELLISNLNGIGILIEGENEIQQIHIINSRIQAEGDGIQLTGNSNYSLKTISIQDSYIQSFSNYAVNLSSYRGIDDLLFQNDSIISKNGAVNIYNELGDLINFTIDSTFFSTTDSSYCCSNAFRIENNNSQLINFEVKRSIFYGYVGLSIMSYFGIDNMNFSNSVFNTFDDALQIDVNYNLFQNVLIQNSTLNSVNSNGFYFDGNNSSIKNLVIDNSTIKGGNGISINSTAGLDLLFIDSSFIEGFFERGISYSGQYSGLKNVSIVNSILKGKQVAIDFNQSNQGIDSLIIDNNLIIGDSSFLGGQGIHIESEYSPINDMYLSKNTIKSNSNVLSVYAQVGGVNNSIIEENQFLVSNQQNGGIGCDIENVANNFKFINNLIDTTQGGLEINSGIYIDGYNNNVSNLYITGNTINNVSNTCFDIENVNGKLFFENNNINSFNSNQNLIGIYIYEIDSLIMSGNTFYTSSELNSIDAENINYGKIYNNLFSGFSTLINGSGLHNILFANNSFNDLSEYSSNSVINIDINSQNNQFINNIINVDTTTYTGNLFTVFDNSTLGTCINNVYNLDTTKSNFISISNSNQIYPSLYNWKQISNKENNSFLKNVEFVDEMIDLHVKCSETYLNSGSTFVGISNDIDGNNRGLIPSIGADEILKNGQLFLQDSIQTCTLPIQLSVVSSLSSSFMWSTNQTDQVIDALNFGTYFVTIDEGCGDISDSIIVTECDAISSVNEYNSDGSILYPNPVSSQLFIDIENPDLVKSIEILDQSGRLLSTLPVIMNSNIIEMTKYQNGVYFIRINQLTKSETRKIIKI